MGPFDDAFQLCQDLSPSLIPNPSSLSFLPLKRKMAPIFPSIGITPQIIDDKRLKSLRSNLESLTLNKQLRNVDPVSDPLDIERLVALLEPWPTWTFEEQVSF